MGQEFFVFKQEKLQDVFKLREIMQYKERHRKKQPWSGTV